MPRGSRAYTGSRNPVCVQTVPVRGQTVVRRVRLSRPARVTRVARRVGRGPSWGQLAGAPGRPGRRIEPARIAYNTSQRTSRANHENSNNHWVVPECGESAESGDGEIQVLAAAAESGGGSRAAVITARHSHIPDSARPAGTAHIYIHVLQLHVDQ